MCEPTTGLVIAITAHRKLATSRNAEYSNKLVNLLADFFLYQFRMRKPARVITGGALGGDTGAAVAALRYGVPLTVAVPHYNQEARWSQHAKDLYYRILDRAKEVVFVEPGPYAAWKLQARNEWMVQQATQVLALWSGSPGGTANCVDYATRVGKPVVNLWDEWAAYRQQYKL